MRAFLEKLDRKAGRWLETLDDQVQEPILRAMTGKVFTHGASSNGHEGQEQRKQQAVQQIATVAASPTRQPITTDVDAPHLLTLRNADASSEG